MVAPRLTRVGSDLVNGNESAEGRHRQRGDLDTGGPGAVGSRGVREEAEEEDGQDVDQEETTEMLPWKAGSGRSTPTLSGSSRSSRSSPVYVSVATDDTLDSVSAASSSRLGHRRRCPITALSVCDHFIDFVRQFYKQLLLLAVFGVTGAVFLAFSRQYVFKAIDVLKNVDVALQCTLFLVFFVICSFPLMWGYIVLVISAGFLHGAIKGSAIVIVCAGAGVTISHFVLSSCLRDVVKKKILPSRNGLKALINAVDGVNGMRVVCLARLTPIPFGIQNAIFAISVLPRWKYVAASMLGLLPGQLIEAYIGSSLKNLGELYSHSHASPANVTIVAIQIGFTLCLFYYLFYLAKKELSKITTDERGGGAGVVDDSASLVSNALSDEVREAEIRFHIMETNQNMSGRNSILADHHVVNMDTSPS